MKKILKQEYTAECKELAVKRFKAEPISNWAVQHVLFLTVNFASMTALQ